MIGRQIRPLLERRLTQYPAVALVGPRQAGKTTLARSFHGRYFDLEQEADRLRLDVEWPSLAGARELVILDEAQTWPEVFPRLRGAIDAGRRRHGRFLLLGSVSPTLMHHVSESLAGRLSVVELTPFLLVEVPKAKRDHLWLVGGYPDGGIMTPSRYPRWQRDYLALLTQRDLPAWGLPARPQVIERLARIMAAAHGQVWNASQIGQSLGLSYHTVNRYVDFLEGAYLLRRLPPFHANLRKRLVKSPKYYWRDSGLLHALHGVPSLEDLLSRPWVGASFEGFVIEQILGTLAAGEDPFEAFFLRTSDQREVDLILDLRGKLWAIEIKLTTNPSPEDLRRLEATASLIGAGERVLISRTPRSVTGAGTTSCSLPWFLDQLRRAVTRRAPRR